jgi:hypothetical protein
MSMSFCSPVAGSFRVELFVNDVYYNTHMPGRLTCDVELHFLSKPKQNQDISL